MKILLDANLSWRLIKHLEGYYEQVIHVDNLPLEQPAKDIEIWNFAKNNDFIIITNDEDFLDLSLTKGHPPRVVLLRLGNQSTAHISRLLIEKKKNLEELKGNGNMSVLEIY
ncbi:MAG: DUF5615 family PIN-like protein [Bacteroidota bacterium]